LAVKPKYDGEFEIKIDDMGATHGRWDHRSGLISHESTSEK
jgi:hypothetical protein